MSACFVGATVRSSRACASSSSFARVSCRSRCFGPSCVAVMNGRLICVVIVDDSSIFAFSRRLVEPLQRHRVDAEVDALVAS